MSSDLEKVTNKKLIEHFQSEIYNHKKSLIDVNENIKTEVEELQIWLRNISNKIDEIEVELKKRCENGKIESIKSDLIEKITTLQTNVDNKIDEVTNKNEIKLNNDEIQLMINQQTIDKSIMGIEQRINQLEINIENKINGIFEMKIDKYALIDGVIWSEYFYAQIYPYKFRLRLWKSFGFNKSGDKLLICLCICDDAENQYLRFPFTADVTIKIINKNKREVNNSITKYCQIEKPKKNSTQSSDKFIYSFSKLTENGVLESSCFIVQCCVEMK